MAAAMHHVQMMAGAISSGQGAPGNVPPVIPSFALNHTGAAPPAHYPGIPPHPKFENPKP
jgi:hypothetical protein